jgi:GMP synthase (glutamine-hydrolysing)
MDPRRLLLVQMGAPAPALQQTSGDYPVWFGEVLAEQQVALTPVAAYSGAALPDPSAFDGVLTTGSPLSVTTSATDAWMARTGAFLVRAAEAGKPVLGICFGHQLLAQTLGGKVEQNPRGREIGTIDIALTPEGKRHPLLGTLPSLRFQATHQDAVTTLPPGATLVAENGFGVQAFSYGERVLGVQFHPELDARRMAEIIQSRQSILSAEGIFERARDSVTASESGRTLLQRWVASIRG